MYRQWLVITVVTVYAMLLVMFAALQPDTYLNNMLGDSDCFTPHHVQFEDGSCLPMVREE
jgi:hypothetical protein